MRMILASLCVVLVASPAFAEKLDFDRKGCEQLAKKHDAFFTGAGQPSEYEERQYGLCIKYLSCEESMRGDDFVQADDVHIEEHLMKYINRKCAK